MSWITDPISEEWLKEVGFRWHQFDRQPDKHWLLWLGDSLHEGDGWSFTSFEDLGIELTFNVSSNNWFCWLRADTSGRYSRFLHVRHLRARGEVIQLVVALTGGDWRPDNHLNGCALRPEQADRIRVDRERLDQRMLRDGRPWHESEKDESRGRPLLGHVQAALKNGGAQ